MMEYENSQNKKSVVTEAARAYIKRGWSVLPIPFQSKKPVLNEWQNLEISEAILPNYFNGKPQNIGIILGRKSGGLVDVDLDSFEAVKLARWFLPKTSSIFGRGGKPSSHWLYFCEDAEYRKLNNPLMLASEDERERKKACMVEIRTSPKGKGVQTVFPPSVHESGELIKWQSDGEPARVAFDELNRSVSKLAAASLLAKYWRDGVRHDLAMAVSGALLRHGFSKDEVRHFIKAICSVINDEEMADRLQVIEDTAKKLAGGENTFGLPKLAEFTDEKIVKSICEWLGIKPFDSSLEPQQDKKPSQATKILSFIESLNVELFHTSDRETFAFIETNGHAETHRINTKGFRSWLSYQFFKDEKKMPSAQALQDAIGTLEGKALFDGRTQDVFIRFASFNERIYIDLCNDNWQIIEIDKEGWQIIESKDAPIRFKRTKAMLPLPMPNGSSNVGLLRQFLNVNDENYVLILAWLISCFRPDYPFPILIVTGEHGTAKSTTSKVLRELIDPNKTDFRAAPRDERDLVIAANNAWVCAYDNLSSVPDWLSDALCRISTGGGFSTRTLYENDDETIFAAKRPILINGIGDIATRSDLLDRAITTRLEPIPDNRRKTESVFWQEFEAKKPDIFSALLTVVSKALANVGNVKLSRLPRMADFAQWAVAAEKALGLAENSFIKAYQKNRENVNELALEGSLLADTVKKFCENNSNFEGTLGEFLTVLNSIADETTRKSKDYPKSARGLRSKLERIAPNLRVIGINVKFFEKGEKGRRMILEDLRNQPSEQSETSETQENDVEMPDGRADGSTITNNQPSGNGQPHNSNNNNQFEVKNDISDGSDGQERKCSYCGLDMELTSDKTQFYCPMGCGSIPA